MAKVTDVYKERGSRPVIVCDFTPPRGVDHRYLENARDLDVDFISVAYNPGKAVRVDSVMLGYSIKKETGRDVVVNLAVRDMNRLALESHILGASVLGLENLLVLGGDPFSPAQLRRVKDVGDFKPTELIRAVRDMNRGLDYRGRKLRGATDMCVGGVVDLSRGVETEARLSRRKVVAGAQFLVTQPIFCAGEKKRFEEAYEAVAGEPLGVPVFYGLQILVAGGVTFAQAPAGVVRELDAGRDGVDIAAEAWEGFKEAGIDAVYLVPPILKGGARDYQAAGRFLERIRI